VKKGKVYLVGAGPGDMGLVTRKALECLEQADVVVYDRLLDERLLEHAPPEAEKINAGKSSSRHIMEQEKINRLLVKKAKENKIVVRLKGGDPFVLGRGGEEAEALADDNIPFEIVPGITSAIAVPAYAGIPVTHRGLASSFAVVTGHEDPDKTDSSVNWEKLATGVDTLVFLMGVRNLPEIVAQLVRYGRSPDTPVAVVHNGTRPEQITITGTLKDIAEKVKEHRLNPPAVVIVGDVVRLNEKLCWFDNRPLSGKYILVTRARCQASELSRRLSERGAIPIELPTIDIQPIEDTEKFDLAISNLGQYQWTIFTSVNGVEAFFERLYRLKLDARAFKDVKIGAIGPATARSLEQNGIIPDFCPDVYTSAGIIEGLESLNIKGLRFLLPRADIADTQLSKGIVQLGGEVDEVPVYRTVPAKDYNISARNALSPGQIDVITFTSSSTVLNLIKALKGKISICNAVIACIGPKTADTAKKAGLKVDIVASVQTIPGLVSAIEEYFTKEK
jgi:uroporphyrinogen III methyltransferase/synthase